MANAEKTATIEDLAGKFRDSSGAVLTEYRGLTVAQLRELRNNLRGNATFNVTKNTLAKVEASTPQADEAPATTDTAAPAEVTEAPEVADAANTETQD